jgi:hypothetical protein
MTSIEFYLGLFELIKEDLKKVVNESKTLGKIWPSFSKTFLFLIPKKKDPSSFEAFLPISYCNLIYKLIAKIIVTCLKPIFRGFNLDEQFGFLNGRQIHEAVSIAQEVLHSFKSDKVSRFLVKLDLNKSYDKVRWIYMTLALIEMGLNLQIVDWIMGSIESSSLSILINGYFSSSICTSKGLWQCFPLLPFIFLLVVDGLSRLIVQATERNLIKRINCLGRSLFVIFCL